MDPYVKSKLKEWKLERFIGIFRENEVSKKNFHLLTKDALAGLIPATGPRMTFLKNFENLKMQETFDGAEGLNENSSALYKTNIKTVLSKNQAGRKILSTLKSGKPPTNFLKKKLAVYLFDDLLESYGPNPSLQLKMEVAQAIVKEFPHLYIQKETNLPSEESQLLDYQKEIIKNNNPKQQQEIEHQSSPQGALESCAEKSVRRVSSGSNENSDHHYSSSCYSEDVNNMGVKSENNILSYQDESCDTVQSGSFALVSCDEPIIKKEWDSYYDSVPLVEEPLVIDEGPDNCSLDNVPNRGSEGSKDMTPAATNGQDLLHFDVRATLEKTDAGKRALEQLDNHDVTEKTKRIVIRVLVHDLADRFGLYPPPTVLERLATTISEEFPLLYEIYGGHETWFSTTGKKKKCCGLLHNQLIVLRKKYHPSINTKQKEEHLKEPKSSSNQQEKSYTDSEIQKAQEEIMDQLNKISEEMDINYCQENENLSQSNHESTTGCTFPENKDSAGSYEDCVAVTNDDQFDNADEMDGLTVVAYDDYCDLKCQNDILEQEVKKEIELRQSLEEKLAKVEAEKLALQQEVLDYRNRRFYTRWKHNTVEYCRRNF